MAKQNVTFIERHLEKIVLGTCGAILLGVCALYLIRSPHTVEVNGESLGPTAFYQQLREKADQSLRSMKSDSFSPAPEQLARVDTILKNLRLRDADPTKMAGQLAAAFVMPSPPVPELGSAGRMQLELAQIVAPIKPVVGAESAGRSLAKIPDPTVISGETMPPPAPAITPVNPLIESDPTPAYWITLASAINRKDQRDRFTAADYHEDRKALILAGVEAVRQELLPSGEWGPEEPVKGYSPVEVKDPPRIVVEEPSEGEAFIAPEMNSLLDQFRNKLNNYDQHQAAFFLRPAFQQVLVASGGDWWEWWVPRKLPGVDADMMNDYGVAYPDDEVLKPKRRPVQPPGGRTTPPAVRQPPSPREARGIEGDFGGRGIGRGEGRSDRGRGAAVPRTPAPAGPPADPSIVPQITEWMKKADTAVAEKDYLEAEKLWTAVRNMGNAPELWKKQAEDKLLNHKEDIEAAFKAEKARVERKQLEMTLNFGPNMDPIWLTDTTVTPGRTYRYKLRLLALNSYAGEPGITYLKNLKDAEKVILPGEWSEWSDPITARPDRQFFAWKMADDKTIQVDLWKWSGKWEGGNTKLAVGEPLVYKVGRVEVTYDGTIASTEPNRPFRKRTVNAKDGKVTFAEPESTHAVLVVNSRGDVEEHLVAQDNDRRQAFNRERLEEIRIKEELGTLRPSGMGQPNMMGVPPVRPTPMMDMPGGFGPPGRYDERGMMPGGGT